MLECDITRKQLEEISARLVGVDCRPGSVVLSYRPAWQKTVSPTVGYCWYRWQMAPPRLGSQSGLELHTLLPGDGVEFSVGVDYNTDRVAIHPLPDGTYRLRVAQVVSKEIAWWRQRLGLPELKRTETDSVTLAVWDGVLGILHSGNPYPGSKMIHGVLAEMNRLAADLPEGEILRVVDDRWGQAPTRKDAFMTAGLIGAGLRHHSAVAQREDDHHWAVIGSRDPEYKVGDRLQFDDTPPGYTNSTAATPAD